MRKRFLSSLLLVLAVATRALTAQVQDLPTFDPTHWIRIHVLNVGQGLCTIIECSSGNDGAPKVIYDCGGGNQKTYFGKADAYMKAVLGTGSAYSPPDVLVSHSDRDHMGYLAKLFAALKVKSITLGGYWDDYDESFQEWAEAEKNNGAKLSYSLPRGDNGKSPCGGSNFALVTVNAWDGSLPENQQSNSDSLVATFGYGKFTSLFAGDATSQTLASALTNMGSLNATLLIAPHHGAFTEGSNSFVWGSAVKPSVVVYSAGHNNKYLHPRCAAMESYQNTLLTARTHNITCGDSCGDWATKPTSRDEYVTYDNGGIVIYANNAGNYVVFCNVTLGINGLMGEQCST